MKKFRLNIFCLLIILIVNTLHQISLSQEVNNSEKQRAQDLFYEGTNAQMNNQHTEAINYYMESLSISKSIGDKEGEINALQSLGNAYYHLKQYNKSISSYQTALKISQEIQDANHYSRVLASLLTFHFSSDYDKKLEYYEKALIFYQDLNDVIHEVQALHKTGIYHLVLQKNQKALQSFEKALSISVKSNDKKLEGESLKFLGDYHLNKNQYDNAISKFEQALFLFVEISDFQMQSEVLRKLAEANVFLGNQQIADNYYEEAKTVSDKYFRSKKLLDEAFYNILKASSERTLGNYSKALSLLKKALDIRKEYLGSNSYQVADVYHEIGKVYIDKGRFGKAITYIKKALEINESLNNEKEIIRNLKELKYAYFQSFNNKEAIKIEERLQKYAQKSKEPEGEYSALLWKGFNNLEIHQYEEAIKDFSKALEISRELKDTDKESQILNNMSSAYESLYDFDNAIKLQKQALDLAEKSNDYMSIAKYQNNLAGMYQDMDLKDKALNAYNKALDASAYIEYPYTGNSDTILNNIGVLYSLYEEYSNALNYFEMALDFAQEELGEPSPTVLENLGNLYLQLGQNEKALEYYNKAMDIVRNLVDEKDVEQFKHITLSNSLGYLSFLNKNYDMALSHYDDYLEYSRSNKLKADEAYAYVEIGNIHLTQNNHNEAVANYKNALKIYDKIRVNDNKNAVELNLAMAYLNLNKVDESIKIFNGTLLDTTKANKIGILAINTNNLMAHWRKFDSPLAIYYGKQSVNLYQEIRKNIVGLDRDIRRSFLKSKEDVYRDLAALLIENNRLPEALRVLEMLKEEEFSDYIKKRGGSAEQLNKQIEYTPFEQKWITKYNEIGNKLTEVGKRHNTLSIQSKIRELNTEEQTEFDALDKELKGLKQKFNEYLANLEKGFSSGTNKLVSTNTLDKTSDIQTKLKKLEPGTVVIYTLVNNDKYYSILVSSDRHEPHIHPINKEELNKKINDFRFDLKEASTRPEQRAKELYYILLGDLKEQINSIKPKTVMWSLDGALRYIPMTALHNGEKYLIEEEYTNVVYTPVVDRWFEERKNKKWTALGMGVSEKYGNLPPLSEVEKELDEIIKENNKDEGIIKGKKKINKEFTQDEMLKELKDDYSVVHIATHFVINPPKGEQSYLLLGDGDKLTVSELQGFEENLFEGVDLLTLSACDTGTGSRLNGKEVEGLNVLAQRKGAKSVIATLWRANDQSTKEVMKEFYRLKEEKGYTKAQALTEAQKNKLKALDPHGNKHHPFYWAHFVLVGNWL